MPFTGRDDDLAKLREIVTDVLMKMGLYSEEPDNSQNILIGPDNKIGKNVLELVKQTVFSVLKPEFPGLHLRKSCMTINMSAYQTAGAIQLLQYMRDDDSNEWAKMVDASHIDVATKYLKRLAATLRLAFLIAFTCSLPQEDAEKLKIAAQQQLETEVAEEWFDRFLAFLDRGSQANATFALHVDMMRHLEAVGAIALAERLGGSDGYNLLLAVTKTELPFNMINGATNYGPFILQLLRHHYQAGCFYKHFKESLFSTPLTSESMVNMATDTKREMDHQVITKGFRCGSTMDSVLRRTALADDLSKIHKIREDQRHHKPATKEPDLLGWATTEVDINYISPTVSLVLRRDGLSTENDPTPYNVYAKKKTCLPTSILDRQSKDVGEFLIKKYVCKERLFGCSVEDLPDISTYSGDKDLLSKAQKAKGITIKRTSKTKVKAMKTEREKKEEKRKREVASKIHQVECLSSDMNACQALVKPDCTKPKLVKSKGIADALKNLLCQCCGQKFQNSHAKDKYLEDQNLVSYRSSSKYPLPSSRASKIKIVIVEFAGVKFKTNAITGKQYIQSVEQNYLHNTLSMMPKVDTIVIAEEKYSFTPDDFKAATRDQRTAKSDASIHHLKTGHEMLSSQKFNKAACITTPEGKSLIGTYVAQNLTALNLKKNVNVEVDSELHIQGCMCKAATKECQCNTYAVPLKAKFGKDGVQSVSEIGDVKQRKGEAEMAAADWMKYHQKDLKPGEAVANIVSSGDIDAVVIFLFVVATQWPRNEQNCFINPVYVLLQKPSGTDVYNITSIIEKLECAYNDSNIAIKVALILFLGGNDFIPKMYGIGHSKFVDLFMAEKEFIDSLFRFEPSLHMDIGMYINFVKHLYCCKKYGDPKQITYESVRKLNMTANKDPRKWLPPASALHTVCKLFDLQIAYLLTAGHASAPLPDFLGAGCLQKAPTGEVEYNFGCDSHLTPAEITELTAKPKTPVKKPKKRRAENTPGRRKKKPQMCSTPVKTTRSTENRN